MSTHDIIDIGILSIITPVDMIILGYWAFSDFEAEKNQK